MRTAKASVRKNMETAMYPPLFKKPSRYMTAQPAADTKIAAVSEDATQVAIPMRKGDETATLRAAIDEALNELSEEGVLTELSEKYFGIDISQAE